MRRASILALLALLAACRPPEVAAPAAIEQTASDDLVELTLKADRDRLSVAGNLTIRLEAAFPESQEVRFPEKLAKEGEFRSTSAETSSRRLGEDGKVRIEQTYVLEPYVPGSLIIPGIPVRYRAKGTAEDEQILATQAFEVEVEPVASAEDAAAELRDIHDPLAMPFPAGWIAAGTLAALAAGIGAWLWWKSRQQPVPVVEVPPETPDALALRRLEALVAEGLAEKGLVKELYGGVSNILRQYIEARFGLHAPEQTTEEFLSELRRTLGFDPAHRALLRAFLEHTDMVKFAEARPSPGQVDDTLAACRRFILETKPKPEAVEGPVVPRA